MADTFIAPGKIICGSDALLDGLQTMKKFGKKALIVTDMEMVKLGYVEKVSKVLEEQNIPYVIEDGINGEPDDGMIAHGLQMFQAERCDFLIALGGGSPIDAMKAIGMLDRYGGQPQDYINKSVTKSLKPMVAIPTTSGTGSEATQFTIISDRKTQVKMLLKGSSLIPNLAIIDPGFTLTIPRHITASTGADALTHAIEAYTSKKAQPLSDIFAISACKRIFQNLRAVCECGNNENGRGEMSLAALEAGIAFNNASVTLVHGMSRPIGAVFHVPHGTSNGILLNACLTYAVQGEELRFAQLSRACGLALESDSDEKASEGFLKAVHQLLYDIQIPNLSTMGVNREQFFKEIPKMARDANASGSPAHTRREVTVEAMEQIYKDLWKG